MAIQQLEVRDYRSFHDITWQPRKLNLLVGPNGSGKSNLLRLLELISNVAKGRLGAALKDSSGLVPLVVGPSGFLVLLESPDRSRRSRQGPSTRRPDPGVELQTIPNTSSYHIVKDPWKLDKIRSRDRKVRIGSTNETYSRHGGRPAGEKSREFRQTGPE